MRNYIVKSHRTMWADAASTAADYAGSIWSAAEDPWGGGGADADKPSVVGRRQVPLKPCVDDERGIVVGRAHGVAQATRPVRLRARAQGDAADGGLLC